MIPLNPATAAASGGTPWGLILPVLYSFLSSSGLFGGEDEEMKKFQEQRDLEDMMRRFGLGRFGRQEQMASQLSPEVLKALVNQLQRTSGWGYPAGMGMDLSFLDKFLTGGMGAPSLKGAGGLPSIGGGTRTSIMPGMLRR